jgi:hypothetical protein
LKVTLAFTDPVALNGQSFDFVFPFELINTPNTGNAAESADIVKLTAAFDPSVSRSQRIAVTAMSAALRCSVSRNGTVTC